MKPKTNHKQSGHEIPPARFLIVMQAMSMGKHIYVEKPMGHTFQEVELMMEAEKIYRVAAQTGLSSITACRYRTQ